MAAGSKPGYYAREIHEMNPNEFTVNVDPVFLPSVTDEEKIKFEKRIKITSTADWVGNSQDQLLIICRSKSLKTSTWSIIKDHSRCSSIRQITSLIRLITLKCKDGTLPLWSEVSLLFA